MDSVQGWVDKEQIRRLSERLMAPVTADMEGEAQVDQRQEAPVDVVEVSEPAGGLVTREKVVRVPLPEITKAPVSQSVPVADDTKRTHSEVAQEESQQEEPQKEESQGKIVESLEEETEEPKPHIAQKAVSALAQARAVAEKSGAITKASSAASTSRVSEEELSFFEALEASLHAEHGVQGLCALDRDADVLYENVQIIAWRDLLVALLKGNNPYIGTETPKTPLHVCLRVTAKLQLQILSTMTSRGVVVLGLFVESRLTESVLTSLVEKMKI